MKQEELDKVCDIANEILKAIQNCVNKQHTRLTGNYRRDMVNLFRKQVSEKCGISD